MMQEKSKLYLENSVISMYFQDDVPYLRDLTHQFWENKLTHFNVFISDVVFDEIRATKEFWLRDAMESLIEDFEVIKTTDDIARLAELYLSYRRMSGGDALHLASASIGNIDFIVTWNLRHLYKRGTQEIIREINTKLMLSVPIIVTPEDFFGEDV